MRVGRQLGNWSAALGIAAAVALAGLLTDTGRAEPLSPSQADSQGYERAHLRSMWPYRDWVIDALNKDMPFDQFTIEQLAGDLLPNATEEQKIATGFHRNTMINQEGGADPKEFFYYAIVDRAN